METKEIEVRFLEIDKEDLVKKLLALGAKDLGEVMLEEVIFYDQECKWRDENKFIRLRKSGEKIKITYKQNREQKIDSAVEIEFEVSDMKKAEALLEKTGLIGYRHQQKLRHIFELGDVTIDIDTWPRVPPYVELEGPSEEAIKETAQKLGLNWADVVLEDAGYVLDRKYGIPVTNMRWFTFDRFE